MMDMMDMSADDLSELKREMRRVIECGWECNTGTPHNYFRFTFRVTPETFERWKELAR